MTRLSQDNNVYSEIKALPLFQESTPEFITGLVRQAQVLSLEKGQILCLHEDKVDRFFIITKGWIKLFRETLDGTQVVMDVLTKSDMFGEIAIFQDNVCAYSAEAADNAEVISLPLTLLKNQIKQDNKMSMAMLESMARFRQRQDREIEHLTIQNASQRIGCFLLRLACQQQSQQDDHVDIRLPYDKTLLASRLGMQPETFSRALKKLSGQTDIEIQGNAVKIKDIERLTQYSCVACSSDFPCKDLSAGC